MGRGVRNRVARRARQWPGASAASLCLLLVLTACGGGSAADTLPHTPFSSGEGRATTAAAPESCTSDRVPFPKTPAGNGSYIIEPDQWNAGGTVCLGTPGGTGFTVSRVSGMVPRTVGSPGAYANIATAPGALGLPVPVSALGDATADWSATAGATGSYDLAFDLWYGPNAGDCVPADSAELMVWVDATDNVQPAGSPTSGDITLGDADYQVYLAPKSSAHTVISYVRTVPTHTVRDLDLRLFTADAEVRGYVPPHSYLCKVSAGFEIWSGGVGLGTTSFDFRNTVGLPSGPVRSDATGRCLGDTAGRTLLVDCGSGTATRWTLANDGTVRDGDHCLARDGATGVGVASCTGAVGQRWSTGADRQVVDLAAHQCLTEDPKRGLLLAACAGRADQHWGVPYNGAS